MPIPHLGRLPIPHLVSRMHISPAGEACKSSSGCRNVNRSDVCIQGKWEEGVHSPLSLFLSTSWKSISRPWEMVEPTWWKESINESLNHQVEKYCPPTRNIHTGLLQKQKMHFYCIKTLKCWLLSHYPNTPWYYFLNKNTRSPFLRTHLGSVGHICQG